ncbi:orotate phosphoribosyltransferase [Alteribacter populi]|uniref:orotate phosphoribosyltransferase n=1 Tax=Alteribacter populi TaxID=2011011 RepID=UPI000BBB1DFC|nr:orotate phosphoribosyltransferase [Alteribacter populi]
MNKQIANHLLSIEAVSLKPEAPFTWSSGLKAPIYCDNRVTMSYPDVRRDLILGFVKLINTHYPEVTAIAGTATAGIPHAAWVAEELGLPMVYVRSKPKEHGKKSLIEGRLKKGDRVVVIEDLISTGGSSIHAAKAVKEAGAHVLGVAAIFTYGLAKGKEAFDACELDYQTITDFKALVTEAVNRGEITANEQNLLLSWQQDPIGWSQQQ